MNNPLHLFAVGLLVGMIQFFIPPARALSAKPVTDVRIRFLFLDETAGAYSLKTGGSYHEVGATPYRIGRPITVKPGARLELFKASPSPDPITGEPIRHKISVITAPADTSGALVVVTPRPAKAGATGLVYDTVFFDDDPRSFPARSIRILNLGQTAMAAQFGTERTVTPPGESRIVQPAPDRRNRVFGKIAVQTPTGWELLYNHITMLRPEERVTGVFVYSLSGLRHTYTDREIEENGAPAPGHFWLTYGEIPGR